MTEADGPSRVGLLQLPGGTGPVEGSLDEFLAGSPEPSLVMADLEARLDRVDDDGNGRWPRLRCRSDARAEDAVVPGTRRGPPGHKIGLRMGQGSFWRRHVSVAVSPVGDTIGSAGRHGPTGTGRRTS